MFGGFPTHHGMASPQVTNEQRPSYKEVAVNA
jgi:hypothetical protein